MLDSELKILVGNNFASMSIYIMKVVHPRLVYISYMFLINPKINNI